MTAAEAARLKFFLARNQSLRSKAACASGHPERMQRKSLRDFKLALTYRRHKIRVRRRYSLAQWDLGTPAKALQF